MRCLIAEFYFPNLPLSGPKIWLLTSEHRFEILTRVMECLDIIETWIALFISNPCVFALCMCVLFYHKLKFSKTWTDFWRVLDDTNSAWYVTKSTTFLSQFNWGEFQVFSQRKYERIHWWISLLRHLPLHYLPHQRRVPSNQSTIFRLAYNQSVCDLVTFDVKSLRWKSILWCSIK